MNRISQSNKKNYRCNKNLTSNKYNKITQTKHIQWRGKRKKYLFSSRINKVERVELLRNTFSPINDNWQGGGNNIMKKYA